MRKLNFFALVSLFFVTATFIYRDAAALHQVSNSFQPGVNYVVIGAFAVHQNAIRFTSHAKSLKYDARYEFNPNRGLYYVYVLDTRDRERALSEARRLRVESEFIDAWVYGGVLGDDSPGVDINPVTEGQLGAVRHEGTASGTSNTSNAEVTASEHVTAQHQEQTPVASTQASSREVLPGQASREVEDAALGKRFIFELYRASDNRTVDGDVQVIDTDRSRKLATYKGNEPVRVASPASKSGNITLISEVFGYRKVQHDLNYNDPQGPTIREDANGNVIVPFELIRLQRGDIAVMYNVYFFKDAGVMRPESRYEVNSLLEMLRENPKYKIRIHGHTNGNAPGKIISMGEEKNYFSLTGTKEGFGSAKKLSQERAEVIRDYLLEQGIDASRMQIKAWGGKRPIHDKNSPRAEENVRVEVEILED
ncbi:MAG: OmpA family protein [Bacteroidota bacterium]|jgi:outer membrane protein OmpA-like peptidoglycan-associated protein